MAGQGERIGRYVLDRLLGRGGMGEVWEASLHGLHGFRRRVALKIVTADAIDDESRNTLIAEARMGAMLHHPNICGTLELGHDGGHWFIAMELVEGATLRTLAKQGLLSPRAVIEAGIQTCRGLEHVHASGLVHRDIKESNLVVDRYGMVKIVDLGVARLRGAASGVGGTPGYMPAEQLLGREGAPADIFALGATLFRITSGRRPFGKRDDAIRAVLDMGRAIAGLDLSTSIEPFVPGLGAVVADCLAQEPEARPTAADLGDRLRRLLRGLKGRSLEDGVAAVRLEAQPSPPASSESRLRRGRFPRVPTAMIGRADVLDQVHRALAPGSVVTLAALGGMGKTRLSLAVAAGLDGELEGGSWFVDLSEVTALEGIRPALAGALGLKADEEGALDAVLATPRLLVLDNVEQLPGAGAEIIEGIAAAASTSPLLVTSRVPLGLERETVVRLEPLSGTASLELLTERNPELKRADEAVLDRIVGWLEGSPLAIELTAAQTRTVPVEEVERRLSRAFDAVEDESGEHPLRHQSLRATLDGSWALLQPTERSTLAQLTVFAGGFLPEAAIAVVDGPGVQDALAFLVDCSLLQIDRSGRLRMLPSTAAYAKEHLADPDALGARTRHVAW
ncbi:MAG: protein kinase, partial [Myxococcales bacterium]|nr:protein kinase [Myxococcales bacterium]